MKFTSRELWVQRLRAAEKDERAIIARDYSASRMNATKWREVIENLGPLHVPYRLQWVDVAEASVWMRLWIPHPDSVYFDSAAVGPFTTISIEWLEIDSRQCWGNQGHLIETDQSEIIEQRLQEIGVFYNWQGPYIRIVGHVRSRREDEPEAATTLRPKDAEDGTVWPPPPRMSQRKYLAQGLNFLRLKLRVK